MKKIFILIAFLFSVVCYAAPPPDEIRAPEPYQVIIAQVDHNVSQPIAFTTYEINNLIPVEAETSTVNSRSDVGAELVFVREVAKRPKDSLPVPVISSATKKDNAELTVWPNNYNRLVALESPPSFYCNDWANNSKSEFLRNKQHTNYGYPFTAN